MERKADLTEAEIRAPRGTTVEPEYLSLRALSAYSNLSVRTLRGYLSHPSHPLTHYRVGGRVLVKRSEFDCWLQVFRVDHVPRVDELVADVLGSL